MSLSVDAIPGARLRWQLSGRIAEPNMKRWKAASSADRAAYWPILAERLLVEWRGQMLAGRGRRGKVRRALPISRVNYRLDGEGHRGPGLLPRREESRAYRHARVTPYPDLARVTGYFGWGSARFLSYHHEGVAGRGIPIIGDDGRVRWMGLSGQVTGIVRDILPTATTISLAVSSASARWARQVTPKRSPPAASVASRAPRRQPTPSPRRAARP